MAFGTATYYNTQPTIGIPDLNTVYTSGNLGYPWTSPSGDLPAVTMEEMFGQITWAQATDATAGGGGAFIFLKIPVSTTVSPGLLYYWKGDYTIVVVPTADTSSAVSGTPIAVAVNTVASNASSQQGTWFQVQGRCTTLKGINAGAAGLIQPNVPLFTSNAVAGRVQTTSSVFRSIIGLRSANMATVTSTTSAVLAYLNFPSIGPGK